MILQNWSTEPWNQSASPNQMNFEEEDRQQDYYVPNANDFNAMISQNWSTEPWNQNASPNQMIFGGEDRQQDYNPPNTNNFNPRNLQLINNLIPSTKSQSLNQDISPIQVPFGTKATQNDDYSLNTNRFNVLIAINRFLEQKPPKKAIESNINNFNAKNGQKIERICSTQTIRKDKEKKKNKPRAKILDTRKRMGKNPYNLINSMLDTPLTS